MTQATSVCPKTSLGMIIELVCAYENSPYALNRSSSSGPELGTLLMNVSRDKTPENFNNKKRDSERACDVAVCPAINVSVNARWCTVIVCTQRGAYLARVFICCITFWPVVSNRSLPSSLYGCYRNLLTSLHCCYRKSSKFAELLL